MRPPASGAVWTGAFGSVLIALGGLGAGAVPVDGGPAAALGLPGATFGHGATLALVICWTGMVLLVVSWLVLGRLATVGRLPLGQAVWATALWSLPFAVSVPVFSRDAWSYLAQGALLGAGISPYEYGPAALPGVFTDEVSPDWRSTATPYGPLHLWIMRVVVALAGDRPYLGILVLRLLVFVAIAGLCLGVTTLARRVGVPPGSAVWASTACPLAVLHFAGGLHNEVFVLLGALAAVIAALDGRCLRAALFIGLALAVKITAVLVAPFLLWLVIAARRERAVRAETRESTSLSVVAGPLTTLAVVPPSVVAALVLVTGTGTGMLTGLTVSDRVVNYLSLPTALAHLLAAFGDRVGFDDTLAAARVGGRVVLALTLVVLWWTHRRSRGAALRGIVAALVAFVALNSLSWPWYHAWVGVFWASARPGRRADGIAAGVVVFLVAAIGPDGSTSLYSPPLALLALAAAVVTVWWWFRTPSPGPDGSPLGPDHRARRPPAVPGGTRPR